MIKGIGVDIVEIGRFEAAMRRYERLIPRLFTAFECEYCYSRRNPHAHFAVRFAAKEAAVKALGTGRRGMKWTDLEVCRDTRGRPFLRLNGDAVRLARDRGVCDVFISLSFSRESAVASAIAVGTE